MGRKQRNSPSPSFNPPPPAKSHASHAGVSPTTGSIDDFRQEQSRIHSTCGGSVKVKLERAFNGVKLGIKQMSRLHDLRQEQSKKEPIDITSGSSTIEIECKHALTAINLGNRTEALRRMKNLSVRYESSALVYRVRGTVYFKVASVADDGKQKQKALNNAVESAKRAVSLSPLSIEYTLFYSKLLYATAKDIKDYEQVVQECIQALGIKDPLHSAKPSLEIEDASTVIQELLFLKSKAKAMVNTAGFNRAKKRLEVEVFEAACKVVMEKKRVFESSSSSGIHRLEKEANAKKINIQSSVKRTGEVLSYWNSRSGDEKRKLLEIQICDLREYMSSTTSFKDCSMVDKILTEAIGFAEKNKTWKFWACSSCDDHDKFIDSESLVRHLKQEHMGNLSPKLQSVVPVGVDADSFEMFLKTPWKPVDTPAAMGIIKGQSDDTSTVRVEMEWPLSNDSEREEILEEIREMFQLLLKNKCLAVSHLKKVMTSTMEELHTFVPASQLLIFGLGLDHSTDPLCICFLGASQLKKVLKFLREIAATSASEKQGRSFIDDDDDEVIVGKGDEYYKEIKEEIVLTGDSSCLLLDERLLHDVDFVHWLFAGLPTIGQQLASWGHARAYKNHFGIKILQLLEKQFCLLRFLCETKYWYCKKEAALEVIQTSRIEEHKKSNPQSYEFLLTKRLEEATVESHLISNILQEAQGNTVNQAEDYQYRMSDYLHLENHCIQIAVQRQEEQLSTEICDIDAVIVRIVAEMKQLESDLDSTFVHDYRSIVMPLLRSFILAHLEDLVDKEATKKSDSSGVTANTQEERTRRLNHSHGRVKQDEADAAVKKSNICGTGLRNDPTDYNCFLNVIIQSLWHLGLFRCKFLSISKPVHVCTGDPCVVCALYEIFKALHVAFVDMQREAVDPNSLRIALGNLQPNITFFKLEQLNDASEVLGVIFDCLHWSFTSGDTVLEESKSTGSWDCTSSACIAHTLFGMDKIERMECSKCGVESRQRKCTSFFHFVNAESVRTKKIMHPERPFHDILKLVEKDNQLTCTCGCGQLNNMHHILTNSPHVFTTVIGWKSHHESAEHILATLTALATEIDIGVVYRGLDGRNRHRLISVVCYSRLHYLCFTYSRDYKIWKMFDDKTVKVIGCWEDVVSKCEGERLQPQVLFFEAVE